MGKIRKAYFPSVVHIAVGAGAIRFSPNKGGDGTVLVSMLLGVRELRASLMAGVLLLATGFIALDAWGESLLALFEFGRGGQALLRRMDARASWAVAALLAYLVGSFYVRLRNLVVRKLAALWIPGMVTSEYLYEQTKGMRFLLAPISRPSLRRLGMTPSGHDKNEASEIALNIIFSSGRPLLAGNEKLHTEYDRLRGEAEFRDAVAIPLLLLVIVLLSEGTTSCVGWVVALSITLAVTTALVLQARSLDREANSLFAHAVADGLVELSTHKGRRVTE